MIKVLGLCFPVERTRGQSGPLTLVCEVETQLGHSHLPAETHHLPEHLFRILSHQALLDVADIRSKIANCCDPCSAGGRDVIVVLLVTKFNAMLAKLRHAT